MRRWPWHCPMRCVFLAASEALRARGRAQPCVKGLTGLEKFKAGYAAAHRQRGAKRDASSSASCSKSSDAGPQVWISSCTLHGSIGASL